MSALSLSSLSARCVQLGAADLAYLRKTDLLNGGVGAMFERVNLRRIEPVVMKGNRREKIIIDRYVEMRAVPVPPLRPPCRCAIVPPLRARFARSSCVGPDVWIFVLLSLICLRVCARVFVAPSTARLASLPRWSTWSRASRTTTRPSARDASDPPSSSSYEHDHTRTHAHAHTHTHTHYHKHLRTRVSLASSIAVPPIFFSAWPFQITGKKPSGVVAAEEAALKERKEKAKAAEKARQAAATK